jgi:hypothetical protein
VVKRGQRTLGGPAAAAGSRPLGNDPAISVAWGEPDRRRAMKRLVMVVAAAGVPASADEVRLDAGDSWQR